MLAPMTNSQSHEDGTLSDEEFHWLTMRAKGQFGLTMTCASHVQANGKGFLGQLGIFGDEHLDGHIHLAAAIRHEGSLAVVQLHHAGIRSPRDLVEGGPVGPSDDEKTGSRALRMDEVHALKENFIAAAVRAQKAGYDGVEIHGAHGYILCQFLSPTINRREDEYGGSLENRAKLIFEIVSGIRAECGDDFLLGIRLSPERFGMQLEEVIEVCRQLIQKQEIDFLDISLWDCFKEPAEEEFQGRSLLSYFTDIDRGKIQLTVAGKIDSAARAQKMIDEGVDFITIGKAAILHHNYPVQVMRDPKFKPVETPVTRDYLAREGLSPAFVDYMSKWPGFVSE